MSVFQSLLKSTLTAQYNSISGDAPSTKSGDWEIEFISALQTSQHGRSSDFDQLIRKLLDKKDPISPDALNSLLIECTQHKETKALHILMTNGNMKHMVIPKGFTQSGWEILVEAMPQNFLIEALEISPNHLDASTGKQLFEAFEKMPALCNLWLRGVVVNNVFFFDFLTCPALKALTVLQVTIEGDSSVDSLARKILNACELNSLVITESMKKPPTQHEHLGLVDALIGGAQKNLQSLQLQIDCLGENSEKILPYMKLLQASRSTLVELNMGGSCLEPTTFNQLLEQLPDTSLQRLLLPNCCIFRFGEDINIQLSPLSNMPHLLSLDLSGNNLGEHTLVPLLFSVNKNQLISLNLNRNLIGPEVVKAVAEFLRGNNKLESISLYTNQEPYSDEAIEPLTSAMEDNKAVLQFRSVPKDAGESTCSQQQPREGIFELRDLLFSSALTRPPPWPPPLPSPAAASRRSSPRGSPPSR